MEGQPISTIRGAKPPDPPQRIWGYIRMLGHPQMSGDGQIASIGPIKPFFVLM